MVNDNDGHWTRLCHQFESELLLQSLREGRTCVVRREILGRGWIGRR